MSNVYISEPPTTGHVIITTNTYGSIDIHLYCKECPTITKYFLQLCLHEYYHNVFFHRILSNLLIQTGLVRYTGDSSSSSSNSHATTSEFQQQQMKEYNKVIHANESYERSKYEIHSRIRFNHRGQVAMALPIDNQNDNHNNNNHNTTEEIQEMQPQFFITTDEAPYLNGKHVIFGTVVGPTIFNVIRINQYSTSGFEGGEGGGDNIKSHTRMIDTNDSSAPRIISIKIVTNPFEQSMIPKSLVAIPWLQVSGSNDEPSSKNNLKKKKRKGKLDINVLSFGDEIENVTAITVANTKKKQYSDTVTPQQLEHNSSSETVEATTATTSTALGITTVTHRHVEEQHLPDDVQISPHELPVHRDVELPLQQQSQLETNDDIKPVSKPMSAVEAHRAKYLSKKQKRDMANNNNNVSSKQKRDDETLNKLLHFRRKIHDVTVPSKNDTTTTTAAGTQVQQLQQDDSLATRMARRAQQQADEERKKYDMNYKDNDPHSIPSYHGQILNDDNNDDDVDPNRWMQTKFVCKKHMDHLSGDNKDAMEEYVVIDPQTKKERKSSHKNR